VPDKCEIGIPAQLIVWLKRFCAKQAMRDHEFPEPTINTKSALIHTPFGLDGIFTFH
jgi:hypothetical protein